MVDSSTMKQNLYSIQHNRHQSHDNNYFSFGNDKGVVAASCLSTLDFVTESGTLPSYPASMCSVIDFYTHFHSRSFPPPLLITHQVLIQGLYPRR